MEKQLLLTLLLGVAAITTSVAPGAVLVRIPDESPGVPVYARTDFIPHNEEWAAIVFYRDPACVPGGFNLLDFYDVPAVFGCPLTMAGFEIWENGPPPIDAAPLFTNLRGLGHVPVWFVSWPDLQVQIADGILTIADLESMESLQKGDATFFEERLHPYKNYNVVAHGLLEDGRFFSYEATVKYPTRFTSVNIKFK